ncbi:MAG TPA: hypothetical protein VGT02_11370 [Methylomirabilota bacterium]|jgi:hypothetical protein|nr:hypothetical protein [Methylomirabilota bacterium]
MKMVLAAGVMAAVALAVGLTLSGADEDLRLEVEAPGSIVIGVPADLVNVRANSTDRTIAEPTYAEDAARVTVQGIKPGTASIVITADRVQYLRFGDVARPVKKDDVDYYDYSKTLTVTVVPARAVGPNSGTVTGGGGITGALGGGGTTPSDLPKRPTGPSGGTPSPGTSAPAPSGPGPSAPPTPVPAGPRPGSGPTVAGRPKSGDEDGLPLPPRPGLGGPTSGAPGGGSANAPKGGGGGGRPSTPVPEPTGAPPTTVTSTTSVVVALGKTQSATFPSQTVNTRAIPRNPAIASASVSDDTVTIKGLAPGETIVDVAGDTVQFVPGWSSGTTRGGSSPLGSYGFRNTIHVTVTDSDEKKADAGPKPKRKGPAPSSQLVYEVRLMSKRHVRLPSGTEPITDSLTAAQRRRFEFENEFVKITSPDDPKKPGSKRTDVIVIEGKKEGLTKVTPQMKTTGAPGGYVNETFVVKVLPCDLTGVWTGSGGAKIVHAGDTIAITRGKYTYKGEIEDKKTFKATYKFTSPDEMNPAWPAPVRQMLAQTGLFLSIDGTITDCEWQLDGDMIPAQKVRYKKNTANPGGYDVNTEPERQKFTFRRAESTAKVRPITTGESAGLRGR